MHPNTAPRVVEWAGDPEKHPLRVLRKILGWSQEKLVTKAGRTEEGEPRLTRLDVNALEKGKNKGTSARIEGGLSTALGLPRETVRALLDFQLDPAEAAAMSGAEPVVHERPGEGADPYPSRARAVPFLRAVKVHERHIERLYTEPDLQSGMADKDRLFWMGVALRWHNEAPDTKAKKAVETIRAAGPEYRKRLRKKHEPAPASERPAKRRRAVGE